MRARDRAWQVRARVRRRRGCVGAAAHNSVAACAARAAVAAAPVDPDISELLMSAREVRGALCVVSTRRHIVWFRR